MNIHMIHLALIFSYFSISNQKENMENQYIEFHFIDEDTEELRNKLINLKLYS